MKKNDFASGASSKSSKLVHGGVRYLEKAIFELDKAQYNLVNEGLKERAIFLKNISNFSKRLNINIPTYSYLSLLKTYIGLYIYRFISGKRRTALETSVDCGITVFRRIGSNNDLSEIQGIAKRERKLFRGTAAD